MQNVVLGALYPRQGHAEGARGPVPAEGDHGAAEDEARVRGQRVGRHQEVHLRRLLSPGALQQKLYGIPD